MPIDMNQVLQTFIDETTEMLQSMEKALLDLELNAPDPEKINLLFRVMHSIKSGSAIFGFTTITQFSHELESLLQKVRAGEHKLTQFDTNLLFSTIDALRTIIADIQNKRPVNEEPLTLLSKKIAESLKDQSPVIAESLVTEVVQPIAEEKPAPEKISPENKTAGWHILFKPNQDFLNLGNDPLRVFEALSRLGIFEIQANNIDNLPSIEEIDLTQCYLNWDIRLFGNIAEEKINDIISWVGQSEALTISALVDQTPLKQEIPPVENKSPLVANVPSPVSSGQMLKERSQVSVVGSSIRVSTEKIDSMMNIIGELVITQSRLNQIAEEISSTHDTELHEGLSNLDRNSRELQDSVMRIRMVPVGFVFNRFPRLVHDLAVSTKKQVELIITGETTEIDKMVMETISDPLLHLVRNAIDHGIELPYIREKLGKPLPATIELRGYQEGGNIVIDVKDDGAGLNKTKILTVAKQKGLIQEGQEITDEVIYKTIFAPGFSTASTITDISGRGVGLDIVYRNVIAVGGRIDIQSTPNEGSVFSLRLPLTLAIMDCQLVRVNQQIFIIPLNSVVELFKINPDEASQVDKPMELYPFRGEYVPMIHLDKVFNIKSAATANTATEEKFLIVVEFNDKLYSLICDELLGQQQVVIKSIEENYSKLTGISGATILGNGEISLIVDVSGIIMSALQKTSLSHEINEDMGKKKIERLRSKYNLAGEPDKQLQILTFLMAGREFGIDIINILELLFWRKMTPLPNVPPYVKGVINLHGAIVPVVDLREQFDLGACNYEKETSIITLKVFSGNKQRIVGIVADKVCDTFTILQNSILATPENINSRLAPYVFGLVTLHDKMIPLLEIDELFDFEQQTRISEKLI